MEKKKKNGKNFTQFNCFVWLCVRKISEKKKYNMKIIEQKKNENK